MDPFNELKEGIFFFLMIYIGYTYNDMKYTM
jgi:hypothetical protein